MHNVRTNCYSKSTTKKMEKRWWMCFLCICRRLCAGTRPSNYFHPTTESPITSKSLIETMVLCDTPSWTLRWNFTFYSPRMIEAGITVLQEIGLDPGIDHLLAMECFDQVKELRGEVGATFGRMIYQFLLLQ